jgi:threonine synthase
MPATHLSCRRCGARHELEGVGTCTRCFGPLDPVYDWDELRRTVTRGLIESGPPTLWRYAPLLPVEAPAEVRLGPGLTPLVPAPRLAAELGLDELLLKLDTANPTHSFKDRVVAVAAAKAGELGLGVLSCSSTGNLANAVAARAAADGLDAVVFCPADLEREKLVATAAYGATIYAIRGSYDDCSRLTVELSFELPWGFVNVGLRSYYAEGSKTVAYEIAEQLGWELPDVVVSPVASGSLLSKVDRGFRDLAELGLVRGPRPRIVGGQAAGCAPVATAFAAAERVRPVRPATAVRSLAIGNPADGDAAVATVRETGGTLHAVGEGEVGAEMATLASTTGVFGETAAGVTLGALREAVRTGVVRSSDRVVLLVTGDGLKTPAPVEDRFEPVEIAPDADALLESLGVAVA